MPLISYLRYGLFILALCCLEALFGALPHSVIRPCFLFTASCFIGFSYDEMQSFLLSLLFGSLAFLLGYPSYVVFLYPMVALLVSRYGRQEQNLFARAYLSIYLLLCISLVRLVSTLLIAKFDCFVFLAVLLFECVQSFFAFLLISMLSQMTKITEREVL